MTEPVELSTLGEAQLQSWHAVLDLYEVIDSDWTRIGGQLVHLHCAERNTAPVRPTDDIDTVLDVRANPRILETFTAALIKMGFTTETSAEEVQHRWRRDLAQIDVLIPEGVGERAAARQGAGGARTITAPGTTQALERSEPVPVLVGGRLGTVLRPTLVGALVGKAAARTEISSDRKAGRHCIDFVILASLVVARDFREAVLSKKDRTRLAKMIDYCRNDAGAMSMPYAAEHLSRLERAIRLAS